jgi:hypothetical protein
MAAPSAGKQAEVPPRDADAYSWRLASLIMNRGAIARNGTIIMYYHMPRMGAGSPPPMPGGLIGSERKRHS